MMRWNVRKSPAGDWWAHDSTCMGRANMWCMLIGDCLNCGTFQKAVLYACTRAAMDKQRYADIKVFKLSR